MAFQFSNKTDRVDLQQNNADQVGAGAGDDVYVIDADNFPVGNKTITINDAFADGNNKLVLVGGLEIVSSKVFANAIELTLNNGIVVRVLGASTFVFQTGGKPFDTAENTTGKIETFQDFVTASLKTTVPAEGEEASTGGTVFVQQNGGTSETQEPTEPTDPTNPTDAFDLVNALNDLKAAQTARESFLSEKADDALLADELDGVDPVTSAAVVTAIAAADAAADAALAAAVTDKVAAEDTLSLARNTLYSDPEGKKGKPDDQLEKEYQTAQEAVDKTKTLNGESFDLRPEDSQSLDLSVVPADLLGDVTIELASFNRPNNNKNDRDGGGTDVIALPNLATYKGALDIQNMNLGDAVGADVLVGAFTGATKVEAQPGDADYLTFVLTTKADGTVKFTNLIKAETLYNSLTPDQQAELNELNPLGKLVFTPGVVDKAEAEQLATALNASDNFTVVSFVAMLEDNLAAEPAQTTPVHTAYYLQQDLIAAQGDVQAFVAANGDNEALLINVRSAITTYQREGGTKVSVTVDGVPTSLSVLLDDINAALDPETGSEQQVNNLVAVLGDAEIATPTASQQPVEAALAVVRERVALDEAVTTLETALYKVPEGSDLKDALDALAERQGLINDVEAAVAAEAEAKATAADTQALVDALKALDDGIVAATDVLTGEGYAVQTIDGNKVGTDANDIFLLSTVDATITKFAVSTTDADGNVDGDGDLIYVGAQLPVIEAAEGAKITDNLGDVNVLEVFVFDNGVSTTLYFEEQPFAGNGSSEADMTKIILTGVTGAAVSIDTDGFLTLA